MQKLEENGTVVPEDPEEDQTVTCINMASAITEILRSCISRLVTSIDERYRVYKVNLDEWVVVELEPEFKLLKTQHPMKKRLWVVVPDTDRE